MRELACGVCGATSSRVVYESTLNPAWKSFDRVDPYSAHYRINSCMRCGLIYSSPIFDATEVSALYTNSAHTNIVGGEETNVRRTMDAYYKLARPFLPGREQMLDIGCDVGFLLDAARRDGFREMHGLEPVPVAAERARRVPGATVSEDFYENHAFDAESFDLITLVHVVDHLIDPSVTLRRAYEQLKPDGVIFAVVHNSASLLARLLGERFPPYNLYHHYFFSPRTLARLFEKNGFHVMRVTSTYNRYSVGFLVQKVPVLPEFVKGAISGVLRTLGLNAMSVNVPLGNVGIVARRPRSRRRAPETVGAEYAGAA